VLKNTNLVISAAPLPATFKGTPQDLFSAMVSRMQILSPNGANFIFVGDVEPTSNVGPWLKGGTQWYVWNSTLSRYVPVDISASETKFFQISATAPDPTVTPVWLRCTKTPTDADPTFGDPVAWYLWDGTEWDPISGLTPSGGTASRPSAPLETQRFYDTDLSVLVWFERGMWRTVDGVPGDVKQCVYETATDALRFNPGWAIFGDSTIAWRGRLFVQAAKDAGGSPVTAFPTPTGITQRAALETFGEGSGIVLDPASTYLTPGVMALWTLVKL
jgi:hypothetical protein